MKIATDIYTTVPKTVTDKETGFLKHEMVNLRLFVWPAGYNTSVQSDVPNYPIDVPVMSSTWEEVK